MPHLDEQATRLEAETERRNDIRGGAWPFSLKKERKGKERKDGNGGGVRAAAAP